jgi:hypothetical protein
MHQLAEFRKGDETKACHEGKAKAYRMATKDKEEVWDWDVFVEIQLQLTHVCQAPAETNWKEKAEACREAEAEGSPHGDQE